MGTELTIYERIADPIAAAKEMGIAMARSGLLGLPNEEAGMVVALTCLCEQMTPMDYLRRYHTINGQPSMRSDAMLAEFRMNHGGRHKRIEKSEQRAAIEVTLDGQSDLFEVTWEEALDAGWPYRNKDDHSQGFKDNWDSIRGRKTMLWARVVSDAIRTICPEVNAGVYTPEEVVDIDESKGRPHSNERRPAVVEAEASVSTPAAAPVETESVTPASEVEPPATNAQLLEIQGLSDEIQLSDESRRRALERRGIASLDQLTKKQADEMLDKLRAAVRTRGN